MSGKMRIGELLLLKEKIDPWLLTNTLKEQATTGQRLISLLVSRAQLDPDDGAMLLSEQLGYPAAMQRHLERRDPDVLEKLPKQLGSRWVVLPLGRAKTGAIVVVSRDPTPILTAALEHAMRAQVVLAVTPCVQLERLVRAAYGLPGAPEEPIAGTPPTLSDIGGVNVEDATPLPIRRARTVSYMFKAPIDLLGRASAEPSQIERALADVDRAITAAAVERLVMSYVAKRWRAALLVRIDGHRAVGVRGHGPSLGAADAISLPLVEPSTIELARAQKTIARDQPDTASQAQLRAVLGGPTAAAPVVTAGQVVAVLAVGEPIDTPVDDAITELDRLADALGAAYARFAR